MQIIEGELDVARQVSTPNWSERPQGEISLVVIHGISLPAGHFGSGAVQALFCNELNCEQHADFADLKNLKVSSHLFIRRTGEVLQFVSFDRSAWHAGQSCFKGRKNCNEFSVGIELEGTDESNYSDLQYDRLQSISHLMAAHWSLSKADFVGHSEIAPGRKTDPGPCFDWPRFRSNWPVQDTREQFNK